MTRVVLLPLRPLALAPAIAMLTVLSAGRASVASAQILVSANDAKIVLVDGVQTVVRNPTPDTVSLIDLGAASPRVLRSVAAPASVIGPPSSVAITPDGALALVTASMKIDPADPTKTIPNDEVSVIDLQAPTMAVLATLHAGRGANGIAINKAGTLALVANRTEGTVSVFSIDGRTVRAVGKVDFGAPDCWPSGVVFTPDGRRALVTRNNDSLVSVLTVDGTKVDYAKVDFAAGLKPYGIDLTPAGDVAIVANIGAGASGGVDTLTIVDLAAGPPHTVGVVPVGPTLEHLAVSADGKFVSAVSINGTNLPKASPFFHDFGLLKVFALTDRTLTAVAEARIGRWCQGTAWSSDGKTVVVQCAVDRELLVFRFNGKVLSPAGYIKVDGAPVGIRVGGR